MQTTLLERKHHNIEQLSDEWFKIREGRFTSSKAENIIMNGRAKDTIGLSFYTYVYETVENELFGHEEEFENADTQRGNELEPVAFEVIKKTKALDFVTVTKCGFFTLGEHEGSSPDGLVGDDAILEIKAPRRRKFFDIVRNGLDAVDKKWQIQVQHQMRVTGRNKAHLVFIYLTDDGEALLHEIEIESDPDIQLKLEERMQLAIKEKQQYKQYLIEKQWN